MTFFTLLRFFEHANFSDGRNLAPAGARKRFYLVNLPYVTHFRALKTQPGFQRKKGMPATPPTLNAVVRLIAQVGGLLCSKSDGEPGAKTIWPGLDQVHAAAETLRALRDGLG